MKIKSLISKTPNFYENLVGFHRIFRKNKGDTGGHSTLFNSPAMETVKTASAYFKNKTLTSFFFPLLMLPVFNTDDKD